ncbi:Cupredoxin [Podospora didyma]|uniref:Cupredoxin n=1 Tax=Podospora didyma TaxID=330526 RepID=A0AAE0U3H1_9PEZI|nr:Cupredoxin [Podospora didyma]
MLSLTKILVASALAMQASAATIKVAVGKVGLTFDPSTIPAKVGDIVEFTFYARNHSVVGGDFARPCQPAATGPAAFFSGFNFFTEANTTNSKVFQYTVTTTDPIVFYCSQNTGTHCVKGMAGVINPSGDKALAPYIAAASKVTTGAVSPPGNSFGGAVVNATTTDTPGSTTSPAPSGTPSKNPNGAGSLAAPVFGLAAVGIAALLLV